jgi:hypothetical protein
LRFTIVIQQNARTEPAYTDGIGKDNAESKHFFQEASELFKGKYPGVGKILEQQVGKGPI